MSILERTRLAVVPARGGSKRFRNKNIAMLNGKPLIMHTIDVACEFFDTVVFTTDSEKIMEVVKKHSTHENLVMMKRKPQLATDTSKVIDTVEHIWNHFEKKEKRYDQIWLLLPTCPLRTVKDIRAAAHLLTPTADSVVSVTEYEFPPTLKISINKHGRIDPDNEFAKGNSRSQDHPTFHRPNGALYGKWWYTFQYSKNFYTGNVRAYEMPRNRSVDIDTKDDLILAEVYLNGKK